MKITLPQITNGQDLTTLNSNFASIATALNTQVLYRTNPIGEDNTINQDIDYNGHKAYNLSDVLVNGVSISGQTALAQAAATQAAASATTASTQAGIATSAAASATTITAGALQKTANLSDLSSIATAKTNLSLDQVTNTTDANKPVSTAQATALALKANNASPTFTGTVSGITSTMVGLGNVTNTSDANKPVSTAQATAIALKRDVAGITNASNAAAGALGETPVPTNLNNVALTNGIAANVSSVLLQPGDYWVQAVAQVVPTGTTVISNVNLGISVVSATTGALGSFTAVATGAAAGFSQTPASPRVRINISVATTVYAVLNASFSVSTCTANGFINVDRFH